MMPIRRTKSHGSRGVIELADLKDQWLADLRSLVRAFVDGSGTPPHHPLRADIVTTLPLPSSCSLRWDAEGYRVSDTAVRHEVLDTTKAFVLRHRRARERPAY